MKRYFFLFVIATLMLVLVSCTANVAPTDINDSTQANIPTSNDDASQSDNSSLDQDSENGSDTELDDSYSDLEIVAAEFCMAYMNHLKNPYSFTVKSVWADSSITGGYHVYVKFTAQNGFGADEVKEISNKIPITDSVLESIAATSEVLSSLSIYVEEGQNERNDGSNGEWLDEDRIQSYIDDNYV